MKTHFGTAGGSGYTSAAELSNYDSPVLSPGTAAWAPTGNTLYVQKASINPGASDAAGNGHSPDKPFATLAAALLKCIATNDDVIFVLPGHTETVVSAAAIAVATAGVRVVGVGSGRARPTFTFTTATAASFDVTAANCVLENLVFVNGIDAQTAMVNVTAANCTIRDCEFVLADASTQAVIGILASATADRLTVERCHLHGSADAGVTSAISCGATDDTVIRDCLVSGAHSVSGSIANSAAAVNFHVIGCTVMNLTADGNNKAVVYHSSTTGVVARNNLCIVDSSSPLPITAAAAFVAGNYSSSAPGVTASVLI